MRSLTLKWRYHDVMGILQRKKRRLSPLKLLSYAKIGSIFVKNWQEVDFNIFFKNHSHFDDLHGHGQPPSAKMSILWAENVYKDWDSLGEWQMLEKIWFVMLKAKNIFFKISSLPGWNFPLKMQNVYFFPHFHHILCIWWKFAEGIEKLEWPTH